MAERNPGVYKGRVNRLLLWTKQKTRRCGEICKQAKNAKRNRQVNPHFVENRDWYLASHLSYKITNDILTNCRLLFFMTNTYVSFSYYKIIKLQTKNRTGKNVCYGRPSSFTTYRHFRRRACVILQPIKSKFPQKVPEHVTSRSLSTAPDTRHDHAFW